MATNDQKRTIFTPYLEKRYKQANAVSHQKMLQVIDAVEEDVKNGLVPISPHEAVRLAKDSPVVRAVREGRSVALEGKAPEKVEANPEQKQKRLAITGITMLLMFPIVGLVWWFWPAAEVVVPVAEEGEAIAAVITPTLEATLTPMPTVLIEEPTLIPTEAATAVPTIAVDAAEYEIPQPTAEPASYSINPIALEIGGQEFRVSVAKHQAQWEPEGVEWWPGTHVRRVLAVPYDETLLNSVFAEMNQPITVRLRTGATIQYMPSDIRRLTKYKIENLVSSEPSIAVILYGEASEERWVVVGRAVQEVIYQDQDQLVALEEIDYLNVESCSSSGMEMRCTVSVQESEAWRIENLLLTELEWLGSSVSLPDSVIEEVAEAESGFIRVQIAGVVRDSGTAVIAIRGDAGSVQTIPSDLVNQSN